MQVRVLFISGFCSWVPSGLALQLEVLVNRLDVYCPGVGVVQQLTRPRPGSLCRSGSHNAIRSGVRTMPVTSVVAACQPTIRWANTSTAKAT